MMKAKPMHKDELVEMPSSMYHVVDNKVQDLIEQYGETWYEGNCRERTLLKREFEEEQAQLPFNKRKKFHFKDEF
jgi:hypothetical protein